MKIKKHNKQQLFFKKGLLYILILIPILVFASDYNPNEKYTYHKAEANSKQATSTEEVIIAKTEDTLNIERALRISKTIALVEAGPSLNCNKKGLSGERGCHQFMPTTWERYSKEVFGEVRVQTERNAEIVTYSKVLGWLEKGYTERQIFLIWNQGNSGPCSAGVNSKGVKYNSCAYAEEALAELKKLKQES